MQDDRRKNDRRIDPVAYYENRKRHSFSESVLMLVGHALGGSVLFVVIAAISWGLGFGVARLHQIHPFSPTVLNLLHGVEVVLLYLDIGLSGIVLFVGAFRFVKEITGARS